MNAFFREKRKRVDVYIPENLEEQMREFISTSYQRYEKGQLSIFVTQALRFYLDPETQSTHTQIRKPTKYSNYKYDVFFAHIKNYLMSKYHYEEFKNFVIPEKHINEAISVLRDIRDHRSIKDWRSRLEMGGYIERTNFGLGARSKQFKILKDVDLASVRLDGKGVS